MSTAQAHEIERAKWNALATRERSDEELRLPDADFGAYCRRLPTMAGVEAFVGDLRGQRVLELGCGMGTISTLLARSGAEVSALDISADSIDVARRRARLHGVGGVIDFTVAEAESLPYETGQFDVVVGRAVLHHLDVEQAGPELHRVLGDGGRAAFTEPLGTNPVIVFARDHVPYPGKNPPGADVPLSYEDIAAWERPFAQADHREVQLLSAIRRAIGAKRPLPALARADDWLLQRVPALKPLCRYVVMTMAK